MCVTGPGEWIRIFSRLGVFGARLDVDRNFRHPDGFIDALMGRPISLVTEEDTR